MQQGTFSEGENPRGSRANRLHGLFDLAAALIVCLILLPSHADALSKDDFLLVPHFEGQSRDALIVARNQDSVVLVSWSENVPYPRHGYFQRFLYDGTPLGEPVDVSADLIAMDYEYDRSWPAFLPDGRLLAVHHVAYDTFIVQANDLIEVQITFLQVFDTLGTPSFPPVQLADTLDPWLHWGTDAEGLVVDNEGVINVLFWDWNGFSIYGELYLARYDATGTGLGPWQRVTECDSSCDHAQAPRIALNDHGRIVVLWDTNAPSLVLEVPYFRVYDHGIPVTPPRAFTCENGPYLNCGTVVEPCMRGSDAAAAVRDDGSFAVVFQGCGDTYSDSGLSIYAWMFDSAAAPQNGPMVLEDFATHVVSNSPRVVQDDDTSFVAYWVGFPWHPRADFFLQRFTWFGNKIGYTYRVNSPIGTAQHQAFFDVVVYGGVYSSYWFDARNRPAFSRDIYAEVVPREKVGIKQDGDVNYDGYVNSSDIIYLVNYVFKSGDPPYGFPDSGDMNGSCSTTSADIIYLVGYIFKGGPAPQPPCE